jgi:hypothetical protein
LQSHCQYSSSKSENVKGKIILIFYFDVKLISIQDSLQSQHGSSLASCLSLELWSDLLVCFSEETILPRYRLGIRLSDSLFNYNEPPTEKKIKQKVLSVEKALKMFLAAPLDCKL